MADQFNKFSRAMALTHEQMRHIFVEVANGRGHHGDFLMHFARCYCHATSDNIAVLDMAARELVAKYDLFGYTEPEARRA